MRKIALILLLIVCLKELKGQNVAFTHLSVENGLSANSVLSVTQDGNGFMWFGTRIGLNRYDGARFKLYKNDPKDSTSLISNNVNTLYCDSRKILWVGSSGGLNKYNSVTDNFEKIRFSDSFVVFCIYEDRKGRLWVGTSEGLYVITDVQRNVWTSFRQQASISGLPVRSVREDGDGNIWAGTTKGLTKMTPHGNDYTYQVFTHNPNDAKSLGAGYVTAIAEDANHHLWIGTQNDGLNLYDPATQSFAHYTASANNKAGLVNNIIRTILPVRDGKLWIATQEGISILDPVAHTFTSYQHDAGNKKSLSQNSVYSIYEDANGSIWAGTYFGGVNTTYPYTTYFTIYQNNEHTSSLSSNVVSSIVEDAKHNLWIGTEGGGLNYLNRVTGTFTIYKNRVNDATSLGSNLVKAVYIDRDDNVWCGTHGGGLNVLDRATNRFHRYLYEPNDPQTAVSEITSLAEDKDGRFWMVTNNGFKVFRRKGTSLEPLDLKKEIGNFPGVQTTVLYQDRKQNIWVGAGPGLYVINGNTFREVNTSYRVNSICEDADGHIWLGLNYGGVAMYDPASGKLISYTEKDGLPNSNVLGILEDDHRNLWLSTDNGLVKFSPKLKTFQSYTVSDGLPGNDFNYNSYLKDSKGEFFFGGLNGFAGFYPDKIESNKYVAPIVFTGLKLYNEPVGIDGTDGLLNMNVTATKKIVFKHDQDVFTIDFALLNYIKSNKNKYAYRLEGFDKMWNEVNVPSATFTNLPSGSYTLYVKGANNDGVWSEPITMVIKVLPPFWLTWWAYCIYIIAIASMLFLVIRYFFLRELLKKEDELHQVKLNFFTNISHEIRTHLTLVMAPVDQVLDKKDKDGFEYQLLSQVKYNANRLLRLVNELMDFRKAETAHLQLQVSRNNIVPFLQEIYDSFREVSQSKNIRTSFIHDAEDIPVYFDQAQLEKVFFNLLINAFKFTEAGGYVSLSVAQKEGKVVINVKDNGRGIAPEYLDKLFTNFFQVADHGFQNTGYGIGLALSKHIVELHKGTIAVESEPAAEGKDGYTCFTVSLLQGNMHFAGDEKIQQVDAQAPGEKHEALSPAANIAAIVNDADEKPLTLLIAEDNPELRALVVQTFAQQYNIIECVNGAEGWDEAVGQIPDLIISDVMMPEMDGLAFCEKIKTDERTSHIPVILLTAKSAQSDLVSGLETGADVYVTKPFSTKALELNVRNLLASREKMRIRLSKQLQQPVVQEEAHVEVQDNYVNTVDKEFLERVIQLIHEHIDDPDFGVDMLSRKVAMSQPILYKKIKAVTNMSVNEFVKSLRLKKAAELLLQKNMTVYEVAYAVGYNDRKYFSREFKKQFGKTPSEYVGGES
ncbi:MAG: response regulator [Filimonas sp.]|nr:response regulator [Filimonas sp.]